MARIEKKVLDNRCPRCQAPIEFNPKLGLFKCDYCEGFCPSEYNLATDKNGNLKLPEQWYSNMNNYTEKITKYFDPKRNLDSFYKLFLDALEKTKEVLNTDILKVSGGEITLNRNLIEYVKKIHNNYSKIQILKWFSIKQGCD